jgi:hypothetical protein
MAIVAVTAAVTAVGVTRWSEPEAQPAALPAAVAELPPRALAVSDAAVPKSVAGACDDEALRAVGVTLATKKKMRQIRKGEPYRAAYASCLRERGYTS